MKAILVFHKWHVHSIGFEEKEITVDTMSAAYREGSYLNQQKDVPFQKCAFTIIPIGDKETLLKRKLTLKERITGRLNP